MTEIFVDESIHSDAGIIVTALVFAKRPIDELVSDALVHCGLIPGVDEYKSSSPKANNEKSRKLRGLLKNIMWSEGCRLAICIDPIEHRATLADSVFNLLDSIYCAGRISTGEVPQLYFDDGLISSKARQRFASGQQSGPVELSIKSDSKAVFGLQLADMCAHSVATMLRSQMGLIHKATLVGEEMGYDPNSMIEIGFELWAGLRHNLSSDERLVDDERQDQEAIATMKPFGLRVSDACSDDVRAAAQMALGSIYVGCIH
ncbi:MAG: hypothetical protein JSR60_14110 [Proteobacteria bacterium]|nr:hypothetical protein [Pseudomonadota bacterium]